MRIFGRDPQFWLSLLAALIMGAVSFGLPLTADQQGGLNAIAVAVAGILTAFAVHDGQLAAVVGAFKALIALALSFGLHLTPDQQYAIMLIVQLLGSWLVRTNVTAKVAAPPLKVIDGEVVQVRQPAAP